MPLTLATLVWTSRESFKIELGVWINSRVQEDSKAEQAKLRACNTRFQDVINVQPVTHFAPQESKLFSPPKVDVGWYKHKFKHYILSPVRPKNFQRGDGRPIREFFFLATAEMRRDSFCDITGFLVLVYFSQQSVWVFAYNVYHIICKLPDIWFAQTKTQFAGITQDTAKYECVLIALSQEIILCVLHFMHDLPTTMKYRELKKTFIEKRKFQIGQSTVRYFPIEVQPS
uniref:DUF7041 domain-containing protein n=1 Tax=Glossina palpalis gambiensis TaxID=67801 RepID=A0A1B0BU99_9MUSC